MEILMVTNHPYEPDPRVRREAEWLVQNGHDVHVACRGNFNAERYDSLNGVSITRICAATRPGWHGGEFIQSAVFVNPIWYRVLNRILKTGGYDIIWNHDIDHGRLAAHFANRYRAKLVVDLHEMYPEASVEWKKGLSLMGRLHPTQILRTPDRLRKLEEMTVTNGDFLITVSGGMREHFITRYGLTKKKTAIVRNVPDLNRLEGLPSGRVSYPEDEFVVSYIGGMTPQRGIETAIKAMPALLEAGINCRLVLVGSGADSYMSRLRNLVDDLGIEESVEFTGWVEFENVRSYYEASDVTLVLLTDTPGVQYPSPNKMYQAWSFGTAVVVSGVPGLVSAVEEVGGGISFTPGSASSLASALIDVAGDEAHLSSMGLRGRTAILEYLNLSCEMKGATETLFERVSTNER